MNLLSKAKKNVLKGPGGCMNFTRVSCCVEFPFFLDFQLPRKQETFRKLPENRRDSQDSRNSWKVSRDFFPSLIVLPFFLVFGISDLFAFCYVVLTNLVSVFPFDKLKKKF